jgi:hypothetical protein
LAVGHRRLRGKETVKAMAILFYSELNTKQIYLELIKRFPEIEYQQDQLSMFDIFGDEWRLLNKEARAQAEELFRSVISDKFLKGIRYEQVGPGEYLYTRINNDEFKQEK